MNFLGFLNNSFAGLPLWAWAIIVGGGGLALAYFLRKRGGGGGSSTALGQSAAGVPSDPNIDPFTGVPYNIESQINPATGLPAYYGGPGVDPTPTPTPTPTPSPSPSPSPTPTPTPGHWWDRLLQNSRYTVPHDMTLSQIANQFGIQWADIAYNPNNSQLDGGQFLHNAYTSKGGNTVKAGTSVWIPTSMLPAIPPGSGRVVSGTIDQATPFWPQMTDLQAAKGVR